MKEGSVKNQSQRNMTLKWTLTLLLHYESIVIISPSIAGVTYRDHFDFEERYRDVNECNPLYWHPLHLPAYCTKMYEALIRNRIATNTPVRIMTKKQKDEVYSLNPKSTKYSFFLENSDVSPYEISFPIYEITGSEYETYDPNYYKKVPLTPYEKMLEQLKKDIAKGPSSPTVTVMPNLGPVALYKQAVSKKSVNMMKRLAEAYVKATQQSYDDYYAAYGKPYYETAPNLFIYDSSKNNTTTQNKKKSNKKQKNKKSRKEKKDKKEKDNKNKVYKMRTKQGGVVTIIETKNLHLLSDDGFPFGLRNQNVAETVQ